jgi:hypothetical protein
MQRTDHVTRALDLYGTGKDGYQEGDAEQQVPGTVVTAAALNAMQEELARAVEQYVPLDPANSGQLATCLAKELPAKLCTTPEFLDKVYSWENAHGFRSSIGVYGNVVLGPGSNVLYANAAGVIAPREVMIQVPMTSFVSEEGAWQYVGIVPVQGGPSGTGSRWRKGSAPGRLFAEVRLPDGAIPTMLRIAATPVGAAAINVGFGRIDSWFFSGEIADTLYSQYGGKAITGEGIHEIPYDNTAGWAFKADINTLLVVIETAAETAAIHWVKVKFLDPGPRNF